MTTTIRDIAIVRAGDKGDNCHLAIIAHDEGALELLWETLTPSVIRDWYGTEIQGEIERYRVDNIVGMVIVLHDCLGGGAARLWQFDRRFVFAERLMDYTVEAHELTGTTSSGAAGG